MMRARARLIALPVVGLVAAAMLWMSLGTFSVARAQKDGVISRAHTGFHMPNFEEKIFILFIGTDARAREGNPTSKLYDSIQVVAIDPATLKASVVGIPRDTYVPIDGGGPDKINVAGRGGPEKMVRTIERNWGCRFHYYMLVGFGPFRSIVADIGGITVNVEQRLNDSFSDTNLQPGVQKLNGAQALAFARDRHSRADGDLGRSRAQGRLIVGALSDARKNLDEDVRVPLRSLAVLRRYVRLNIPVEEALKLGLLALRIDPKNVYQDVADGNPGNAGGSSIVRLTAEGKQQLFNVCSGQIGPQSS